MTSLLVLGQPYTASRIARAWNARATDIRATFVPQRSYVKLLAMPPRSERVVLMRVGYRVGATTPRGRLFDAYWSRLSRSLPGAARCHYWLGTDVLNTLEEARTGTLRWAAISSTRDDLHLAVAPWLASELESIGLPSATALLPPSNPAPRVTAPLPAEFRVLTYLPEARFRFYGGDAVLAAAQRLPDVQFDVVGGGGAPGRPALVNVHWHGWVADMAERYAKATVVVRIPIHDGFGNTVIEGLLNARHVVYTHEVPFVRRVWPATPEALLAVLEELRDAHVAGRMSPNLAGRDYALNEFDGAKLVDHLMALVRARI
jgi:Glycosyl transferases group 1